MLVYFYFCLLFVEFIQVVKYVGHMCKFSNPTIIFKVFKQMMIVLTLYELTYFMPKFEESCKNFVP